MAAPDAAVDAAADATAEVTPNTATMLAPKLRLLGAEPPFPRSWRAPLEVNSSLSMRAPWLMRALLRALVQVDSPKRKQGGMQTRMAGYLRGGC